MTPILITGATGNVGRELVRMLLGTGQEVRASSRHPETVDGVQTVHVDFEDEASLRSAAAGVKITYLLTPLSMTVPQVRTAVRVLRESGVQRVVFQSGLGAEDDTNPETSLELAVQGSGLAWTFLRPNWFFQNYAQLFAPGIRDRGEFAEPAGSHLTSFIDARDIAAAAVSVLTGSGHEGQGYALTGPEALDRVQVAEAISQVLGRAVTYRPVSEETFVQELMNHGDTTEKAAREFISSYADIRADRTAVLTDDLHRLTGSRGHTAAAFAQHAAPAWQSAQNAQLNLFSGDAIMPPNTQAQRTHDSLFPNHVSTLSVTDPELIEVFDNFAFDEVLRGSQLDSRTRLMVQLPAAIALQALREYRVLAGAALTVGVTPIELKEVVYQAVPYVGMARTYDFLHATNELLTERGITLPLPGQATTTPENREEKGLGVQRQVVGDEGVKKLYASAPADEQQLQRLLSANCFGDHLTRGGLDLRTRELLTFSMLVSLGGCDPQVKGHVSGNLNVGNDRARLIDVTIQLLPFIGYPRTLNALRAIDEVTGAAP